jgi:hypothetical protein
LYSPKTSSASSARQKSASTPSYASHSASNRSSSFDKIGSRFFDRFTFFRERHGIPALAFRLTARAFPPSAASGPTPISRCCLWFGMVIEDSTLVSWAFRLRTRRITRPVFSVCAGSPTENIIPALWS